MHEVHPQDDASIAKQFAGTWRLVSWVHQLADGTTRQDPKSAAFLIYSEPGYMCYVGMNPKRSAWKSATAPTLDEMALGLGNNGFYCYCAAAEVHAKKGFILLRLEVDKIPNMVGKTRKRWFKFEGPNRLALTIDPSENSLPVIESTLVWERVQKS